MALENKYISIDSSEYTFSALRFYLSEIRIFTSKGKSEIKKIHLFDLEDSSSYELLTARDGISSIAFLLGTDSVTNVSGILEGPLDPLLGMYWTWNSGYINFKLEGKSNRSVLPDKSFEYHIGGYLPPFATSRWMQFDIPSSKEEIRIELHLDEWLNNINIEKSASVLIPGEQASQFADQLVPIIKLGHE